MTKPTEAQVRKEFENCFGRNISLSDMAVEVFRKFGCLAPPPNKPLLAEWTPSNESPSCWWGTLGLREIQARQLSLNAVRDGLKVVYETASRHLSDVGYAQMAAELINRGITEGLWLAPEKWEAR